MTTEYIGEVADPAEIAPQPATAPQPPDLPSGKPEPLADILNDIQAYFERYIVFGHESQAPALALWTMYTHCFALGQPYSFVPYMLITSAEPESGKSTVLELAAKLVHNPLDAQDVTPALIGRTVAGKTLLLDEIDGIYNGHDADAESKAGDMRTILNSGFKRNGMYQRLTKSKGGDFEAKAWSTFTPKMLAGIGRKVPDTVQSRSIRLRLTRKTAKMPTTKARDRILRRQAEPLKTRMQLAAELIGEMNFIDDMPDALGSRDQDLWEPLFDLAQRAGPEWEAIAQKAAIELSRAEPVMSIGMRLLGDIRTLYADLRNPEFLSTKDLIGSEVKPYDQQWVATGLCSFEDSPWASFSRNGPITPHKLGEILSEYDIKSARQNIGPHGHGSKGYYRRDFAKAWDAYLSDPEDNGETGATPAPEVTPDTGLPTAPTALWGNEGMALA